MTTKIKEINLKTAIAELHKIYKRANTVLFNNELPDDIVIVIQSRGKRMAYGWMYTKPIWEAGENKELFEIGIASETLNRPYFETITTLIHEMVHVWNVLREVKDTSRGNTYHNKAFLKSCEAIGMEYTHGQPDSKIGYSAVTLTTELENKIKFWGINKEAFVVARKDIHGAGEKKPKKKSNIIKWVCPSCGDIIRSSKDGIKAYCMNDNDGEKEPCATFFERETPEEEAE
jgi:SprT-like family